MYCKLYYQQDLKTEGKWEKNGHKKTDDLPEIWEGGFDRHSLVPPRSALTHLELLGIQAHRDSERRKHADPLGTNGRRLGKCFQFPFPHSFLELKHPRP